jgi:hypothetical protein
VLHDAKRHFIHVKDKALAKGLVKLAEGLLQKEKKKH